MVGSVGWFFRVFEIKLTGKKGYRDTRATEKKIKKNSKMERQQMEREGWRKYDGVGPRAIAPPPFTVLCSIFLSENI